MAYKKITHSQFMITLAREYPSIVNSIVRLEYQNIKFYIPISVVAKHIRMSYDYRIHNPEDVLNYIEKNKHMIDFWAL